MRISDWSSDVCSSDLVGAEMTVALDVEGLEAQHHVAEARHQGKDPVTVVLRHVQRDDQDVEAVARVVLQQGDQGHRQMLAVGAVDTEDELDGLRRRSEEHTSELQSLMRISYAVFCMKKKRTTQ